MKVFIYDNGLDLSNYLTAVEKSGNVPIFSSNVTEYINADALLLTGGGNVIPYLYDEPVASFKSVDAVTDLAETFLIKRFVNLKKPIVGICKGIQILNVYFGGTLTEIDYHYVKGKDVYHKIHAVTTHPITEIIGREPLVNSCHKQAVKKLGENLLPVYTAKDNTIEILTHSSLPIIGVQFHPERMSEEFSVKFYTYVFGDFCTNKLNN